jgi:uncharacterized protein YndB with AHSA1/START domain
MPTAAGSALDAEQQAGDSSTNQPTTIELSRTVAQHGGAVWQALTSRAGTAVWLGEGAVLGGKGESYHCDDGSMGVVRSFHPLEQLRLSWHEQPSSDSTLIEIDLVPLADGTKVRMWHEHVPASKADQLRQEWERKLDALVQMIDG